MLIVYNEKELEKLGNEYDEGEYKDGYTDALEDIKRISIEVNKKKLIKWHIKEMDKHTSDFNNAKWCAEAIIKELKRSE